MNVFGAGLFSVGIRGIARGTRAVARQGPRLDLVLFLDIDVDFETTWGESREHRAAADRGAAAARSRADKAENWRALPAGRRATCSSRCARCRPTEAALILHPVGVLQSRSGRCRSSSSSTRSAIRSRATSTAFARASPAAASPRSDDAFEQFAPAQFQNFSDADKLSQAGLRAGALRARSVCRRAATCARAAWSSASCATRRSSSTPTSSGSQRRFRDFFGVLFDFFLHGDAVGAAASSRRPSKTKLQPVRRQDRGQADDGYAVAFQSNNTGLRRRAAAFHSEASARDFMNRQDRRGPDARRHAARDPQLRDGRMSDLGTYSFLPWLRQGLANQIQSRRLRQHASSCARTCDVQLEAHGDEARRRQRDSARRHARSRSSAPATSSASTGAPIVRAEPRDWITNFEPNYLAHIEFYDEDFPWRYTPAAPDSAKGRLRPWITLIVLERRRVQRRQEHQGQAAALHRRRRPRRVSAAPTSCGHGRTFTSNRSLAANDHRVRLEGHGRGDPEARRRCSRRTRTSPIRVSCARASWPRTPPITRSSCRPSRPAAAPASDLDLGDVAATHVGVGPWRAP